MNTINKLRKSISERDDSKAIKSLLEESAKTMNVEFSGVEVSSDCEQCNQRGVR